jgi:hypothetical protein
MKVGIFFVPQITQIFEDEVFSRKSNSTGKRVWQAFENVCRNFLDKKAENYGETVQELISSHSAVGCNMSVKLHFLHFHFDNFFKTWEPSPVVMAKGYIRIFPKLKKGTLEN